MLDPMVWMQGAVLHVANGDVAEAEARFDEYGADGDCTSTLVITVRSALAASIQAKVQDGTISLEGESDDG